MVDNESQEMYLETILRLKKKKGSVRAIDIAEELGYSKPSVSRAVGIMKKDGFIVVHADGLIDLTETGKDKAENIFSRHKSLTQALVVMGLSPEAAEFSVLAVAALKLIGVSDDSAEENACRVEHVITEEAFEAIKKYFNV